MFAGDDRQLVYTLKDQAGAVVDLTGGSISWRAVVSGTDTAVITKTSPSGGVVLTTPTSGICTVTLDPADTSSLNGTYELDGKFTDSGSNVYTFEDDGIRIR